MKRFHVHISVSDLDQNVRFYSALLGQAPTIHKADYAKWMLDDPRVNFAISKRGITTGLNHLGIQTENAEELAGMNAQLAAFSEVTVEKDAACCYARTDKYWITDPQGIAWETFHTLDSIPVFGDNQGAEANDGACCIPLANPTHETSAPCCAPTQATRGACC